MSDLLDSLKESLDGLLLSRAIPHLPQGMFGSKVTVLRAADVTWNYVPQTYTTNGTNIPFGGSGMRLNTSQVWATGADFPMVQKPAGRLSKLARDLERARAYGDAYDAADLDALEAKIEALLAELIPCEHTWGSSMTSRLQDQVRVGADVSCESCGARGRYVDKDTVVWDTQGVSGKQWDMARRVLASAGR